MVELSAFVQTVRHFVQTVRQLRPFKGLAGIGYSCVRDAQARGMQRILAGVDTWELQEKVGLEEEAGVKLDCQKLFTAPAGGNVILLRGGSYCCTEFEQLHAFQLSSMELALALPKPL